MNYQKERERERASIDASKSGQKNTSNHQNKHETINYSKL